MREVYAPCAVHADALASFQCDGCGQRLCYDCVEESTHLTLCRLCGERALPWQEELEPTIEPMAPLAETLYSREGYSGESSEDGLQPSSKNELAQEAPVASESIAIGDIHAASPTDTPWARSRRFQQQSEEDSLATLLTLHGVIPLAIIAMVSALLFFLLDVRSVFLTGSPALKWLGFWFVVGSVMITRYGKVTTGSAKKGCYTLALGAATLIAMLRFSQGGLLGAIFNLMIVLGVWRFSTALTDGLSLEGEQAGLIRHRRLYGLERVAMEGWQRGQQSGDFHSATAQVLARSQSQKDAAKAAESLRRQNPKIGEEGGKSAAEKGDKRPSSRKRVVMKSPGVATARLAALVLLIFALGEPVLLAGPPQAGINGLGAMIAFLLATGVVLAASAALHNLRRVRQGGGRLAPSALPTRVFAGGLLMLAILAITLTLPGLEYRGSGELRPKGDADGGFGKGELAEEGGDSGGEESLGRQTGDDRATSGEGKKEAPVDGLAAGLLSLLAELGAWLKVPAIVLAVLLIALAAWRLWPLIGSWRGLLAAWRHSWASLWSPRWASFLARFQRPSRAKPRVRKVPPVDPQGLMVLPPKQAVRAAYNSLLLIFDALGHARSDQQTADEFCKTLPGRWVHLREPVQELTALYEKAAYSSETMDASERQQAVAHLAELHRRALSPGPATAH